MLPLCMRTGKIGARTEAVELALGVRDGLPGAETGSRLIAEWVESEESKADLSNATALVCLVPEAEMDVGARRQPWVRFPSKTCSMFASGMPMLARNSRLSASRSRRQTSRPMFIWISANCFKSCS
jgi:hypothetical protein